jgi:hypothetical protein
MALLQLLARPDITRTGIAMKVLEIFVFHAMQVWRPIEILLF